MALSDDRLEDGGFTKKVFRELKSRLHARFVQYEVFTFGGKSASVTVHLTNTSVTVKIPYLIETTSEKNKYILYFRDTQIEGSLSGLMSFIISSMRKEEAKLSKFKAS